MRCCRRCRHLAGPHHFPMASADKSVLSASLDILEQTLKLCAERSSGQLVVSLIADLWSSASLSTALAMDSLRKGRDASFAQLFILEAEGLETSRSNLMPSFSATPAIVFHWCVLPLANGRCPTQCVGSPAGMARSSEYDVLGGARTTSLLVHYPKSAYWR